jgi:hypothetical protein
MNSSALHCLTMAHARRQRQDRPHFVEHWKQASERAPYGEIDQSSQVVAMAQSIGTTFVPLPLIYCLNPDEKGKVPGTVVQHDSAAVHFPKVSGWRRYVWRMLRSRAAEQDSPSPRPD